MDAEEEEAIEFWHRSVGQINSLLPKLLLIMVYSSNRMKTRRVCLMGSCPSSCVGKVFVIMFMISGYAESFKNEFSY